MQKPLEMAKEIWFVLNFKWLASWMNGKYPKSLGSMIMLSANWDLGNISLMPNCSISNKLFFFVRFTFWLEEFVRTILSLRLFITRRKITFAIKWCFIYMGKLFIELLLTSFWFNLLLTITIFVTFLNIMKKKDKIKH